MDLIDLINSIRGWERINSITAETILKKIETARDYQKEKPSVAGGSTTGDEDRVFSRHVKLYKDRSLGQRIILKEKKLAGSWNYGTTYNVLHRATINHEEMIKLIYH